MWREAKVAFVGHSPEASGLLKSALMRIGLQKAIVSIDGLFDRNRDARYDVYFIDVMRNPLAMIKCAEEIHSTDPESVKILVGAELKPEQITHAVSHAKIDWLLAPGYSDDNVKEAISEAINLNRARRRIREIRLNKDLIAASGKAAAIVDGNYAIIHANELAHELFQRGDPFRINNADELVCKNAETTQEFRDSLKESVQKSEKTNRGTFICVERGGKKAPIVVALLPIKRKTDSEYTFYMLFSDADQDIDRSIED